MKKFFIIPILLLVFFLFASYQSKKKDVLGKDLITHAYYGDLVAVKNDLEAGAPLFYEFYFNDPERDYYQVQFDALHAASSSGNEDLINFLIEQGLDIDYPTPQGWAPLFIAAREGHPEAAKLLVFRGAAMNQQTDKGATALLMALTQKYPSEKEREELLIYMLKRGADPNLADAHGFQPIYYTAVMLNQDLTELLLEYGAVPDEKNTAKIEEFFHKNPSKKGRRITTLLQKKAAVAKKN